MSLRFQISIRILLISLFILFLGGSIAIWQARNAVREEVDSSIKLALQLIEIGIGSTVTSERNETDWIFRLSTLEHTRHLNIQLKKPTGELFNITHDRQTVELKEMPPEWFIKLVSPEYPEVEYQISTYDNNPLTLMIQANPLDELTEVWHESIAFFTTILALVLLSFLAVHLVFNKSLKAINRIVESLKLIETGEYRNKLPDFSILEYDSIAKAINHMTFVLDQTRQQNRALTQHSLQIQEEERQHLSQELHDEFGQSLTAIKVMAVTAEHQNTDTKKIADAIIEICDHLMTVVRTMMQQLHPMILTDLGLKATLEDLVGHWSERNPELTFMMQCVDEVDHLDKKITIQVFRVIQECLTNINRHAKASSVKINLSIRPQPDRLILSVSDDGQGCLPENVSSGFGLLGMKERIKSLEGDFKIQSQPGKGMKINAEIPIE